MAKVSLAWRDSCQSRSRATYEQDVNKMMERRQGRPRVSVMVPCFNEEDALTHLFPDFIERLMRDTDYEFDLLFLDDHSTDRTPQILGDLCERYPLARAVRMDRNCGSHIAYRAGLDFCTGDAVAFMVADLQEGLDLVLQSLQFWRAGRSVVGTVAIGRDRGGIINEAGARAFYWIRHQLGGGSSRETAEAALRVIDRDVVEYCRRYAPRTRNLNAWIFGQPFSTQFITYTPSPRRHGESKWSFRRKVQLVIDTMLDASPVFLTMWLPIGGLLFVSGLVHFAVGLGESLFAAGSRREWQPALQLDATLCCTGLVLIAAGTLGAYVWRILEELRGGPGYYARPLSGTPTIVNETSAYKPNST
jgi:glycosyltransferase involved in cell wall biosynthesis